MPTIRGTISFKVDDSGWSENWFLDGEDNYDTSLDALFTLAKLRAKLSGVRCVINRLRVSREDIRRDARPFTTPIWTVGTGFQPDPNADAGVWAIDAAIDGFTDRPMQAVQVNLIATSAQHTGKLFMRGVPDVLIVQPPGPKITSAWDAAFKKWKAELSKWSFRVNEYTPGAQVPIVGWTFDANGVLIKTPAGTFTENDNGAYVSIEGAKFVSKVTFKGNRRWIIQFLSTTDSYLKNTDGSTPGFGLVTFGIGGRLTKLTKSVTFPKIQDARIAGETSRKVGRPFGSPVGRRRVRR